MCLNIIVVSVYGYAIDHHHHHHRTDGIPHIHAHGRILAINDEREQHDIIS